jgi:hypothetical protein
MRRRLETEEGAASYVCYPTTGGKKACFAQCSLCQCLVLVLKNTPRCSEAHAAVMPAFLALLWPAASASKPDDPDLGLAVIMPGHIRIIHRASGLVGFSELAKPGTCQVPGRLPRPLYVGLLTAGARQRQRGWPVTQGTKCCASATRRRPPRDVCQRCGLDCVYICHGCFAFDSEVAGGE